MARSFGYFRYAGALAAALFWVQTALAQTLPGSADAGRVQTHLPATRSPDVAAPSPVDKGPGQIPLPMPEGAADIKLTLALVAIEGMTVYGQSEIEPLYRPLLGKMITVADVFKLADAITTKYRNDGYVLSQAVVPPQEIDKGHVIINIVEGYIDRIIIQGEPRGGTDIISGFARNIARSRPLNAKTLERNLLLMNDIPGLAVRGIISASPTINGAADLTLDVSQTPYGFMTQTDNRGSRYVGPLQLTASGEANSLLGAHERLGLQILTAPDGKNPRELDYVGANLARNIGYQGLQLTLGGSVSSSAPGYTLDEFDIRGLSKSASLALNQPLIRARERNLIARLEISALDSSKKDNLSPDKTVDHLRMTKVGMTWQNADLWGGVNTLATELSRGFSLFGASRRGDANMTRAQGAPDFTKLTAEISRLQSLSGHTALFLSATGQKSANLLLSSEEFGVGGVTYASAYDASEITGEDGFAARTELRYDAPPDFFGVEGIEFYARYDIGKVYDRDNASARNRIRSLASAALGARFDLDGGYSASVEWAVPLTRAVDANGDNHPRVFGSLGIGF